MTTFSGVALRVWRVCGKAGAWRIARTARDKPVRHFISASALPFAMQEHLESVLHGTRSGNFAGVDEEDLIDVIACVQAVRDDDFGGGRRQVREDFFE